MLFVGCAASQTALRGDPQILQMQQYLDSWAGEYRGRVDHGWWLLVTGSLADYSTPSTYTTDTKGWQWEKELRVELSIRFVPDELGGRLHLALSAVDTFQVQPWRMDSHRESITVLGQRPLPRHDLEFEFHVPQNILLLDKHQLTGGWSEVSSSLPSEEISWRAEQNVEFSFVRPSGEATGVLKYRSRTERTGDYRSEEKHEMVLTHLWKKEVR